MELIFPEIVVDEAEDVPVSGFPNNTQALSVALARTPVGERGGEDYVRLLSIGRQVVEQFSAISNQAQYTEYIREVSALAGSKNEQLIRAVLGSLAQNIQDGSFLREEVLEGLSTALCNAQPSDVGGDNLDKILLLINDALSHTDKRDNDKLFFVLSALASVIESVVDTNIVEIDRKDILIPLDNQLAKIQNRKKKEKKYILYYTCSYIRMMLGDVPTDTSKLVVFIRDVCKGAAYLASGIYTANYKSLQKAFVLFARATKEMSFQRGKKIWTDQARLLRGLIHVNRLHEFESFFRDAECVARKNGIALVAIAVALGNVARLHENEAIRVKCVQFLGELLQSCHSCGDKLDKGKHVRESLESLLLSLSRCDESDDSLSLTAKQVLEAAGTNIANVSAFAFPVERRSFSNEMFERALKFLDLQGADSNSFDAVRQLSPDEHEMLMRTIQPVALATGSSCEIVFGEFHSDPVAIKRLLVEKATDKALIESLKQEAITHSRLCHRNIVQFRACYINPPSVYLVLELGDAGDVAAYLQEYSCTWSDRWKIIRHAAVGVQYLHNAGIVHGDIRARNIVLVGADLIAKVCDMGTMPEADVNMAWNAPELLSGGKSTTESDIYAFGMFLWEIIAKDEPFRDKTADEISLLVTGGGRVPIPDGCPESLAKLIAACVRQEQSKRCLLEEIIKVATEEANLAVRHEEEEATKLEEKKEKEAEEAKTDLERKLKLEQTKKEFVVYENERRPVQWGRNFKAKFLLSKFGGDCRHFCTDNRAEQLNVTEVKEVPLPGEEWQWYPGSSWKIEEGTETDEEGWIYALNFVASFGKFAKYKTNVRRRTWIRYMVKKESLE